MAGSRKSTIWDHISEGPSKALLHAIFRSLSEGVIVSDENGLMVLANPAAEEMFQYSQEELRGEKVEILIPKDLQKGHENKRKDYLSDPRERAMGKGLDLKGVRKDGTEFPLEVGLSYLKDEDGRTLALAVITDISKKQRLKKTLQDTIKMARTGGWELRSDHSLCIDDRILQSISIPVKDITTPEEFADHLAPTSKREFLTKIDQVLDKKLEAFELDLRVGSSRGKPQWIRMKGALAEPWESDLILSGVVQDISNEKERERTTHQMVIDTQENERKRISQDLHDSLGQILSAANLHLKSLESSIDQFGDQEVSKNFFRSLEYVSSAISQAKNISHGLAPWELRDFGLEEGIHDIINKTDDLSRIKIRSNVQIDHEPPEYLASTLYRIVQEGLSNAIRHSNASSIEVEMEVLKDRFLLRIKDDGKGFDQKGSHDGMGLKSIQSRCKLIHANFEVDSSVNRGTSLEIFGSIHST